MKKIGAMLLVFISVFSLFGIAGTDDFMTAQGVSAPLLPLILKTLISLAMLGTGAAILNGGE